MNHHSLMCQLDHLANVVQQLETRIESNFLCLPNPHPLGMPAEVHWRHFKHGDGRSRLRQYLKELREITEGAGFRWDQFHLRISDEDARYTTDVHPGIHVKQQCLKYLGRKCRIWDLFSAPGMDILYNMVLAAILPEREIQSVGVSIARDDVEMLRFARLKHNVDSMLQSLPFGSKVMKPELHAMSALDFCTKPPSTTQVADLLWLSPPWMTSRGDMETGVGVGIKRDPKDFTNEICSLVCAIFNTYKSTPKVIACMLPYDWDDIKSLVLLPCMGVYSLAEKIHIVKKAKEGGKTISTYFVFIMVQNYCKPTTEDEFVFYV